MSLDRFDRLLLAGSAPRTVTPAAPIPQVAPARPVVRAYVPDAPVITSTRGPRFADYTACLMCGRERLGLEYQGELMSGIKLHTLAKHSPGAGRPMKTQPMCLGAGMRMKFVAKGWVPL